MNPSVAFFLWQCATYSVHHARGRVKRPAGN